MSFARELFNGLRLFYLKESESISRTHTEFRQKGQVHIALRMKPLLIITLFVELWHYLWNIME